MQKDASPVLQTEVLMDGTGDRCCSIEIFVLSKDEAGGDEASMWRLLYVYAALHMPDVPC